MSRKGNHTHVHVCNKRVYHSDAAVMQTSGDILAGLDYKLGNVLLNKAFITQFSPHASLFPVNWHLSPRCFPPSEVLVCFP